VVVPVGGKRKKGEGTLLREKKEEAIRHQQEGKRKAVVDYARCQEGQGKRGGGDHFLTPKKKKNCLVAVRGGEKKEKAIGNTSRHFPRHQPGRGRRRGKRQACLSVS